MKTVGIRAASPCPPPENLQRPDPCSPPWLRRWLHWTPPLRLPLGTDLAPMPMLLTTKGNSLAACARARLGRFKVRLASYVRVLRDGKIFWNSGPQVSYNPLPHTTNDTYLFEISSYPTGQLIHSPGCLCISSSSIVNYPRKRVEILGVLAKRKACSHKRALSPGPAFLGRADSGSGRALSRAPRTQDPVSTTEERTVPGPGVEQGPSLKKLRSTDDQGDADFTGEPPPFLSVFPLNKAHAVLSFFPSILSFP